MRDFLNFLKSKKFFVNIAIYGLVIVLLFFGLNLFLKSFTRPNETIDVPDFVGDKVNIQDVKMYLGETPLEYEVVETVFRTDLPEGTIFFQQPGPTKTTGMQVKRDRSIKLRISTRSKVVSMPDLAGKSSLRFAEQKLTNRGLKPRIEYVFSAEGKSQVIEQKYKGRRIEPGTEIPYGSTITLVVSKGKSDAEVILPSLVGLTICEARTRLEGTDITASFVCIDCEEGNQDQECQAVVYVQIPDQEYFTTISLGETLILKAWLVQPEDIDKYRSIPLDLGGNSDPSSPGF